MLEPCFIVCCFVLAFVSHCRFTRKPAAMGAQAASPTRRKEGFWQYAKTDAVDRVWARLCAHSRGEGRVKSCSSLPAGSALPAAGGQTGRISRATEASRTRPCTTCGAQAEGAAGPQRDNAPHRGHGEGLRGREARADYRAAAPDERACATTGTARGSAKATGDPERRPGRSDRGGGGATDGEA